MKKIALILALSIAAPLAAHADSIAQKVQQTYHTSFSAANQADQAQTGR
jgi:type III secretory pathway component EscR